MKITFIGHKNTPDSVKPVLKRVLIEQIEHGHADTFYIGHQGNFDYMAVDTLKELSVIYPHIQYTVVLAYMPGNHSHYCNIESKYTMFPQALDHVPPAYAISRRNQWMIDQADMLISYIAYHIGNAAKVYQSAVKKKKQIINLWKIMQEDSHPL